MQRYGLIVVAPCLETDIEIAWVSDIPVSVSPYKSQNRLV